MVGLSLVILAGSFVIACVFAVRSLLSAWATGQWDENYWHDFLMTTFVPLFGLATQIPLAFLKMTEPISPYQMRLALSLTRALAVVGDTELAPVETKLLDRLRSESTVGLPARFGPLARPARDLEHNNLLSGGLALVVTVGCLLIGLAVITLAVAEQYHVLLVALGVTTLVLSTMGVREIMRGMRLRRRITIEADAWGIRMPVPEDRSRTLSIAWHDARSLVTLSYPALLRGEMRHMFALDTENVTIAGEVGSHESGDVAEISDRLCALIHTRTGLVPHDLTTTAAKLTTAHWEPAYKQVFESLAGFLATNISQPVDDTVVQAQRMLRRPARFRSVIRPALTLMVVLLMVPGLLAGAGVGLQRYQSSYYDNLLRQIHTRAPLYHDPLTVANRDWTVHAPAAEDQHAYTFTNGSYQVGGKLNSGFDLLTSLAPGAYGDVAIEVTARQSAGPDYLGVGLVARVSPGSEVVFTLSPSGMWYLARYGLSQNLGMELYSFQGSGYAHKSAGAANRLTLVTRGNDYICYINGQFVGTFHGAPSESGGAGVIIETDGTITGAFTDFAIYPA